jgi:hypothetical protein
LGYNDWLRSNEGSRCKRKDKNGYNAASSNSHKVGILYSEYDEAIFRPISSISPERRDKDAQLIGEYLSALGMLSCSPRNADLPARLRRDKPELVINLVDSVKGEENLASSTPGVQECGYPYTAPIRLGCRWYNKFLVKKLLQQNGTPDPQLPAFQHPSDYLTLRPCVFN